LFTGRPGSDHIAGVNTYRRLITEDLAQTPPIIARAGQFGRL
ncbi:MAG: hypothetical protein QOD10_2421, partial [Mycobacterium sp.]|nr:hypothetical protein [Mycobacterium sp.]